ncbi:carboxymuconolactone decarboxylase family protein [Methylobacterium mesophilicum]|uniref:carboxymuconolactone decarboxylase family protein n=1 Tax=Methylobacterium mesophilicum TaxID=39956 RepID=UPI0032AF28A5
MPISEILRYADPRVQEAATSPEQQRRLEHHREQVRRRVANFLDRLIVLDSMITGHAGPDERIIHNAGTSSALEPLRTRSTGAFKDRRARRRGAHRCPVEIAPDLARYLIQFPFGDTCSWPGLDLCSREIATVTVPAAVGNAAPKLKVHIVASLNVGLSRAEIVEILMQMAVCAGFPAALNGSFAAKGVLAQQDAAERRS